MPDEAYRCGHCKQHKPAGEFPPSQRKNGSWCRACYRAKMCGPDVPRNCDECGQMMVVTLRRAQERWVFCSRTCKDEFHKSRLRYARLMEKLADGRRSCPQCGETLPMWMRADAVFCSEECNSAAHNATRKAKWKTGMPAEYVSRAAIYRRDRGICHLCGAHRPPDDFHLDHLVPLARGGTHDESNLAVACPGCNMGRGARPLERQAALP